MGNSTSVIKLNISNGPEKREDQSLCMLHSVGCCDLVLMEMDVGLFATNREFFLFFTRCKKEAERCAGTITASLQSVKLMM